MTNIISSTQNELRALAKVAAVRLRDHGCTPTPANIAQTMCIMCGWCLDLLDSSALCSLALALDTEDARALRG